MSRALSIPKSIVSQIRSHAEEEKPNEACGYLIGENDRIFFLYRMTNVDHSPEHYAMDPVEQFKAIEFARGHNYDPICVYHSHPNTPARMSEEDKRLAYDTTISYVIYSLVEDELKVFSIDDRKTVTELDLRIIDKATVS